MIAKNLAEAAAAEALAAKLKNDAEKSKADAEKSKVETAAIQDKSKAETAAIHDKSKFDAAKSKYFLLFFKGFVILIASVRCLLHFAFVIVSISHAEIFVFSWSGRFVRDPH